MGAYIKKEIDADKYEYVCMDRENRYVWILQ